MGTSDAGDQTTVSTGSKRAHSPRTAPAKRAKAAQACLSCRKHKTRCEMLDGDNSGAQCHRCKVLTLPCSFEENGAPSNDRPGPSSRPVHTPDIRSMREERRTSVPISQKSHDIPMDDSRAHAGPSYPRNWNSSSSTLPPFHRSQPQEEEVDLLNPERILPERHKPWGFLKLPGGFDGTMVPMLAMQALTRAGSVDDSSRSKVDQSLLHILGREQMIYLTDIFEERYAPWLNLQPSQQPEGPLLKLAQCCVASRHLGPSTRSAVSPQLYRLADEYIFKQAYHPLPSTDAIHAVLESRDGRLIASTAVSMAMNLRLSEAMVYSKTLRRQKKPNELPSAELMEAIDKARLWFALNNVESMLCVGTGRSPISDCDSLIHDAIDTTSVATIGAGRDMRLTLISQMFAATQYGLSIRLRSADEIGVFYKEVLDFLMRMDVIERLIYPLPVLAEHEVFFFTMLQVYYQSCRLLVLVHALMETKMVISKCDQQNPWFLVAEHNGINLARSWGHHALVLSEGILITALSRPELALLSAAPDNFFSMLTLATLFVILSKWSVMENAGEQLPGSSDSILARTIDRMRQVSAAPDHVPAKCARVIEAGVLSFRRRASEKSEADTQEFSQPLLEHFDTAARDFRERVSAPAAPSGYPAEQSYPHSQQSFPSFPINDPNYFMNSDIFLDNDFWSSFMSNLSEGKAR
ncbi:hypothetical protein DFH29DRAFT_1040372 [Suillus ampliporus]|nr:hypothetical protein DFH29DRAFT_1040372 [Suillus ampliporus]